MDQRGAAAADASMLAGAAVAVLTVTCAAAICRAATTGDVVSVAFVVVCYGGLLTLLHSLRSYELALPEAGAERERLRLRVWALCTLLTGLFAWKIAGVVPFPLAVGVWAVAAATSVGGFLLLFNRHQRRL
ncbi:unnamed protein product [Urochloa humidicola]